MDREKLRERLQDIFRDVFDDDSLCIREDTTAKDIEDWDSLEHINLIASVERAFKMRFTVKEVSGMKHVGEMLDILDVRAKR